MPKNEPKIKEVSKKFKNYKKKLKTEVQISAFRFGKKYK